MADRMLELCREVSPVIFRDAGPPCVRGPCPEGKLSCGKPRRRFDDRALAHSLFLLHHGCPHSLASARSDAGADPTRAPVRHLPCARTAFSKLKPIICDKVSGNKDSPICRQDGREPQTERRRNQAAALPSACCFRARFGHAARCRATSGRWKVVGQHPDTPLPPRTLVMSENRPRIPRRPDVARTSSGVRTPPGKCSAITITL